MKQAMRDRQRDLFETPYPPPLPPDRWENLLHLVQALLLETMMEGTVSVVEGGHDQDHA